jgi:hypothetical protein
MARILFVVGLLALVGSGCASYGANYAMPMAHVCIDTIENDFKVAATHLKGSAECAYVLFGIPLGQPEIVSKALAQVRDQAQMDGRPVALVNYTEDRSTWGIGKLFWKDKVTITADLIEYTK